MGGSKPGTAAPDKTDKINVIHSVSLKVDDKLERLHVLINDLTRQSRIMIDASNNIITDHPFVENDLYEVREDLHNLNKLKDEANATQKNSNFKKATVADELTNLNLQKNAKPQPELLK